MRTLGNLLWFIFIGWWSCILHGLIGAIACITIIGIPIGKALFQYAKLMAFPFGKVMVRETFIKGKENVSLVRRVFGTIANIIWLPFGILYLILNLALIIAACITIIGIPYAVVLAKSCVFLLWPIGAKVITREEQAAFYSRNVLVGHTNIETQGYALKENMSSFADSLVTGVSDTRDELKRASKAVSDSARQYAGQISHYTETAYQEAIHRAERNDMNLSWSTVMEQVESALYRNSYVAVILTFLTWILGVVAFLFVIGGITTHGLILGIFYGLIQGIPAFALLGVLFIIQQKYLSSVICLWGPTLLLIASTIINIYSEGINFYRVTELINIIALAIFGLVAFLLRKN